MARNFKVFWIFRKNWPLSIDFNINNHPYFVEAINKSANIFKNLQNSIVNWVSAWEDILLQRYQLKNVTQGLNRSNYPHKKFLLSRRNLNDIEKQGESGRICPNLQKCIFAVLNPPIAAAKSVEKWRLCQKLGKYYTCNFFTILNFQKCAYWEYANSNTIQK